MTDQATIDALLSQLAALKAELADKTRENEELKVNRNYGTLTRQALELEGRRLRGEPYAVGLDIDHLHELNEKYGSQEPVNEMIRRAFSFRHEDLLLKGNFSSGDEVFFIVRADPEGYMKRLEESLAREGITATMSYRRLKEGEDLLDVCNLVMEEIYRLKKARGVER